MPRHRSPVWPRCVTTGRATRCAALFALPFPGSDVPRGAGSPRSISIRPKCRSRRCCRSRPAAVRRTAPIVRRRARYDTGVKAEKLMELDAVLAEARAAQGRRRQPLLHGRGLARAQGPRPRQGLRHGRGREGARAGDLRHARHADGAQARAAQSVRPRLLQPQPRHLAGILRRDHHHAHLPGPARHARARARRRHQCLLRRHRRHGRERSTTASA